MFDDNGDDGQVCVAMRYIFIFCLFVFSNILMTINMHKTKVFKTPSLIRLVLIKSMYGGFRNKVRYKEIQIILRLFLVIAIYCQASSSQIKSITQPPALLAASLGTCSR